MQLCSVLTILASLYHLFLSGFGFCSISPVCQIPWPCSNLMCPHSNIILDNPFWYCTHSLPDNCGCISAVWDTSYTSIIAECRDFGIISKCEAPHRGTKRGRQFEPAAILLAYYQCWGECTGPTNLTKDLSTDVAIRLH